MDASLSPYHDQHQALLRLGRKQERFLAPATVRTHPESCLETFRDLVSSLKAHLAMEDTVLLPALRQASDPRARAQAEAESARAVDLKRHLHEAGHHWTTPETLRRAPEAFIEACRSLLGAMRQHVEREEQGLFPLVD